MRLSWEEANPAFTRVSKEALRGIAWNSFWHTTRAHRWNTTKLTDPDPAEILHYNSKEVVTEPTAHDAMDHHKEIEPSVGPNSLVMFSWIEM